MAKKKTASSQQPETNDTFELDGIKYAFVIQKFIVPGFDEGTAKEALTNKDLLKYLVQEKSGVVQQID